MSYHASGSQILAKVAILQKANVKFWAPLHKTMVTLQLIISLQSVVTIIDFLILIGYGAVLLW